MQRLAKTGRANLDRAESGQAIVIIAFIAIGLIAILGLAIDGGRLLFLRRDAQNAADAAAIAAGRAMCQGNPNFLNIGFAAADANGFDNRGLTPDRSGNKVEIYAPPANPTSPIPPECQGCYLEAEVTAEIPPGFIGVVYSGPLQATGRTISACNQHLTGLDEVGLRAVFGLSDSCEVSITGSDVTITGGTHSNGQLKFAISGTVAGPSTYSKTLHLPSGQAKDLSFMPGSGSNQFETQTGLCLPSCFTNKEEGGSGGGEECGVPKADAPYKVCDAQPDPLAYDINDFKPGGKYANMAAAKGEYFSFIDAKCQSKTVEAWLESHRVGDDLHTGLYYTNCSVHVNQERLRGTITLVSEESIQISGGSQKLYPYMLDLLIFANGGSNKCSDKVVNFSGSNNEWNGNIYAPHGQVNFSGSSNHTLVNGCVVGYSVDFSGSESKILCNATDPDTNPGIYLPE